MSEESRLIIKAAINDAYFMRGALTYEHIMNMSIPERMIMKEFLQERFEAEAKNPHPVY